MSAHKRSAVVPDALEGERLEVEVGPEQRERGRALVGLAALDAHAASTSTTPDVASTDTMPDRPVRSRSTPPCTGTVPPTTLDRPAAGVTGMRASWQRRNTAATWSTEVGRARAPATWPTWPWVAQIMASGHQSRLASARAAGSRLTSGQASASRARKSSSRSTIGAVSRPVADPASPARAMGGVAEPGAGTSVIGGAP